MRLAKLTEHIHRRTGTRISRKAITGLAHRLGIGTLIGIKTKEYGHGDVEALVFWIRARDWMSREGFEVAHDVLDTVMRNCEPMWVVFAADGVQTVPHDQLMSYQWTGFAVPIHDACLPTVPCPS